MKTVQVRIAVAVDSDGDWNSFGGKCLPDEDAMSFAVEVLAGGENRYWLTAELPVPEVEEINAAVTPLS